MNDWQGKLADDGYPLYTMSVVAELLDVDAQVIRRLEDRGVCEPHRPSGNQRRYSRDDIERIAYALELAGDGMGPGAVTRIVALEAEVASLQRQIDEERRRRRR